MKIARERSFGQMSTVGATDYIGLASDCDSNEVYVVGVELAGDEPQLLWQAVEQVLACASG